MEKTNLSLKGQNQYEMKRHLDSKLLSTRAASRKNYSATNGDSILWKMNDNLEDENQDFSGQSQGDIGTHSQ